MIFSMVFGKGNLEKKNTFGLKGKFSKPPKLKLSNGFPTSKTIIPIIC